MNKDMAANLDDILDRFNARKGEAADEVIDAPGTGNNPWIGVERLVNGQKQFHAFSGAELRRLRRVGERDARNETERGQRAYNRQQRQKDFDAGTVRQQLRILTGEIEVTPDMRRNLEGHIIRQTRINERAQAEPGRKATAAARREARLFERRHARVDAGKGRHADLVALGLR